MTVRFPQPRRSRRLLRMLGWWALITAADVVLLAAVIAFYAFVWEPNHVVLERVRLDRAARNGRGGVLRIAQISDLDLRRPPGWREGRARRLIANAKPDFVAFSGDLIGDVGKGRATTLMRAGAQWLGELPSDAGTFIVLGEEERPLREELQTLLPPRVHLVEDDCAPVEAGGLKTLVCGPNGQAPRMKVVDNAAGQALLVGESASRRRVDYAGRAGSAGDDPMSWRDYELSGRLMMTRPGDAFGVVVYAGGTAASPTGYEFSKLEGESGFKLRSEAERVTGEHPAATGIVPVHVWHRFRVQVQTGDAATRLRSKFWRDGDEEPKAWQGELEDRSPNRARSGTIGVVSGGWECGREKYLDDLEVRVRKQEAPVFAEPFTDLARFEAEWRGGGLDPSAFDFVLLIAHSPDVVRGLHYARGVDLILAGHTHGGQAVLPMFGPVESNLIVDPRLYTGTHELGGVTLHVNRGLGTAVIPARIACPPEVTLVEVRIN